MITLTREEAQQVLDALEAEHSAIYGTSQTVKATELLRARLAQPERKWQGLTDEEMLDAYAPNRIPDSAYSNMGEDLKKIHDAAKEEMLSGLRAIEAKLKEKNNG